MTLGTWRPQPGPQKQLIDCPLKEILFGGARGGGKTDGVLGKWAIKERRYGKAFNGVFFRQEMPQADDLIERARDIFEPHGAEYNKVERQFQMPNGGRLRFRPLESVRDANKYQGQNLSDAAIEEAGNYPMPDPIWRIRAALRSAAGVPTQMILTANPGGAGQQWIKRRYIDPAPQGNAIINESLPNGSVHRYIYIPSRVQDNRMLLAQNPDYIDNLWLVGSEQLVRAWLDGDWSVVEGAYFDCWSEKMIVRPCKLPDHWHRFRSFDWGSAKPFSVGWWAVSDGEIPEFPRGALIRYREWYGSTSPNVGLKMTAEQVADGIREREQEDGQIYGVADPAIFAEDGGPSIAERMNRRGVNFRPADNKRVSRLGAMGGWDQMRQRMIGEDGRPMIYTFSTCTDSIRTIPALQHDTGRPEDLDTNGEDHAADEWRYACMSRPWAAANAGKGGKEPDRWERVFGDDDEEDGNWRIA